ncbi:hypothetical protein [Streptomyces bluensis]|uniref:hypothetical protein n=1 Tax=Streptomyces bluensis TaxID=33897 RepID=UPI00331F75DE
MSSDAPVDPAEVPVFTGNLETLELKVTALSLDGANVATAAGDVHTAFGGLRAYYEAPEAEQLFATTQPVVDKANTLSSDMCTIAGALGTYARDIRPLVARLDQLRADAAAFRDRVADDDKWREDGGLIEENLNRRNEIAEVWTQFQAAERAAHATIVGLVGGSALTVNDGSNGEGMYGYDAEALKQSESLPWGDAVAESTPWWQVWEHAWDFGTGVVVDGLWAGIQGLGTLAGFDGWDAAGQAWVGLGKLATGLAITLTPATGVAYWLMPEDQLPGWLRDSRTAVTETGKALLAWDQWGSNPSRAAGAVTFNVVTTVFTGGAGGAASGAGRAGAVARTISFVGRVGNAIDPATYLFRGASMGVSRIGDVVAGLRGMGRIDIPPMPENVITLPEGSFLTPDGTLRLPDGATVPPGAIEVPSNTVRLPEGTPVPAGATDLGDNMVRLPEGTPAPAGSVPVPEGTVRIPENAVTLPEGTVRLPEGSSAAYMDPRGNLYDANGSLIQHAEDAPTGNPAAGADTPRVETPAREPALVGAGAGVADNAGGGAIRLDDGLGDLGDVGRVGDDVGGPGGRTGDNRPGGVAGNQPTNSVDNNLPGGGSHTPGGHAGNHMPTNNLDNGAGGTSRTGDNPTGGAGHTDTPSTGGGHDLPGGSTTDNGIPSGGHPETPPTGAARAGSDDAPRGADGAAHRAEYEAARAKPASERTPAERMAITREHVRLANEDPVWRAEHYDKWGPGKRNNAEEMVDGQLLPKLIEKPDGSWMAADDLPYADPGQFHLTPLERGRNTVASDQLNHLDDVSAQRMAGMELNRAELAFEKSPTDEAAQALADARQHYDQTVGMDVPNNTKLGEALGEEAARRHMLLQREFEGAKEVDDPPLPETPNGSRRFDQLWRDRDGNLIIVEAKGPNGTLDWRQGNGELDSNTMVRQGTIEYVRTVVADMEQRAFTSPGDAKYAAEIKRAIENRTLRYVLVQATENTGTYAGAELKYFKLF